MAKPTATKARRSWLAWRLRSLLILVLIAGIGLGGMIHRARVQRDAVARISKAGGSVSYDWEWKNGKPAPGSKPPWPKWLVELTGIDSLASVVAINDFKTGNGAGDDLMTAVAVFDRLEYLSLSCTQVTDAGLAKLRGLTRLKTLNLRSTSTTGAGLAHLSRMAELENLWLQSPTVTDDDLAHLSAMTKLKDLRLPGSGITAVGMKHLGNMKQVECLDIQDTQVADLRPIRNMPLLKYFYAQNCPIDDAGAAPIAHFRALEELWLCRSRITDASIASFSDLPKLKLLNLNGTQVTDGALEKLARSHSIEDLRIYDTQVTDAGLSAVTTMPIMKTCRTLLVGGPKVSLVGTGVLHKQFPALDIFGPEQYAQQRVARVNGEASP